MYPDSGIRGSSVSVQLFVGWPILDPQGITRRNVHHSNFENDHLRRKTYVCFSGFERLRMARARFIQMASVEGKRLHCRPRANAESGVAQFISDGWFQGLLATEKKRPCKKHYLSGHKMEQNKRSKSGQRAGTSIQHGAYVPVQMDCGESCLINRTPSLLRVQRNRRSDCGNSLNP